MTRRVPGSGFDDHRAVAKDVVVVPLKDDCFASLQRAKSLWSKTAGEGGRLRKHGVAFFLPYEPRGASEIVGIGSVIPVAVREGQVRNVLRCVSDLGQLRFQWPGHGGYRRTGGITLRYAPARR